jgi:hypothetical protein
MPCMRPVLAPRTQSCSGLLRLGGGGNVGQAARMDRGHIQQGGTMGQGKSEMTLAISAGSVVKTKQRLCPAGGTSVAEAAAAGSGEGRLLEQECCALRGEGECEDTTLQLCTVLCRIEPQGSTRCNQPINKVLPTQLPHTTVKPL